MFQGLANIASMVSVIISVVGFAITLYNVNKAKKLSEQIRSDLARVNTMSEFSSAISCMAEIKVLHRMGAWEILPDKYASLRKTLIYIRMANPDIDNESKRIIQGAISTLSSMENEIERLNFQKCSPMDVPKLNLALSKQMDKLHPILMEIQNKIGR